MVHCQDRYHSKRGPRRGELILQRRNYGNISVCVCVCVCGVRALDSENGSEEKIKGSHSYLE